MPMAVGLQSEVGRPSIDSIRCNRLCCDCSRWFAVSQTTSVTRTLESLVPSSSSPSSLSSGNVQCSLWYSYLATRSSQKLVTIETGTHCQRHDVTDGHLERVDKMCSARLLMRRTGLTLSMSNVTRGTTRHSRSPQPSGLVRGATSWAAQRMKSLPFLVVVGVCFHSEAWLPQFPIPTSPHSSIRSAVEVVMKNWAITPQFHEGDRRYGY